MQKLFDRDPGENVTQVPYLNEGAFDYPPATLVNSPATVAATVATTKFVGQCRSFDRSISAPMVRKTASTHNRKST
jgi:hypothetical protein